MDNQFLFGLDSDSQDNVSSLSVDAAQSQGEDKSTPFRQRHLLTRGVLAWLNNSPPTPTGLATNVPTRLSRYKAHIGAFHSKTVRNKEANGPGKILQPRDTIIIQCYARRENCWSSCAKSEKILPALRKLKKHRASLELQIQKKEPELKDPDSLFEEYAEWHYEKSKNTEYHRVQQEIDNLEQALLEGTSFEQLRNAEVANYLYLAVPAGTITEGELADSWGLLWIHSDLTVTVEREAVFRCCPPANQYHFIQNIAAAASHSVNFSYGLHYSRADDQTYLVRPPRGHRKPVYYRLD